MTFLSSLKMLLLLLTFDFCVAGARLYDMESVIQRLEALEQRETTYINTIVRLEKRIDNLESDAASKDKVISELLQRLDRTDSAMTSIDGHNDDVDHDNSEGSPGIMDQRTVPDNGDHQPENGSGLRINDGEVTVRQSRLLLNSEGPFAFHAALDGYREVAHFHENQTIAFDTVDLNVGQAYHENQGLFISQLKGIYVFSVSLLSRINSKNEFEASIVKNDVLAARVYGHGDNGHADQGSVTITMQLDVGDEVWVENGLDETSYWANRYCFFTGFMLVPL